MSSATPVLDRIRALDGDELTEFIGSLWRRAGWEVDEGGADTAVVVGRRAIGEVDERTALYPISPPSVASVEDVKTAIDECDHAADRTTVISTTGFTPDARRLGEVYDVDTMSAEGLARIVVTLGADDLFDRVPSTD